MEQPRKFKKYIYISKAVKPSIEDYCTKNNITLVTRFINEYNLGKFMQTELRNLNSVDYLILDLKTIMLNVQKHASAYLIIVSEDNYLSMMEVHAIDKN